MFSRSRSVSVIIFAVASMVASHGLAVDLGNQVRLHGYGGWVYGQTDGNRYLNGTEEGSYDNVNFALNVSASPSERLTIFGQFEFHAAEQGDEVELDFAFADWRIGSSLHARFGQVQQPFGLYSEIYAVGTLRPFIDLPQSIYGPQGITAEAYRGVGLVGSAFAGTGWRLQYDVYFGGLESEQWHPSIPGVAAAFEQELADDAFSVDSREVLGGRLNVTPPVPGMLFGISAYRGTQDGGGEDELPPAFEVFPKFDGDRFAWGVHFEYLGDSLEARTEYATQNIGESSFSGGYIELSYRFGEHWQIAGRYDRSEIGGIEVEPTFDYAKVFDHEDFAAAVNFWFSRELVIKLEYHMVYGTRFAATSPEDYVMDIITGAFETETQLIQLGAQFSF